jgi:hypothetical protein
MLSMPADGINSENFSPTGYFVASSGNITDEVIIKYIEEQGKQQIDDDFKTDDE